MLVGLVLLNNVAIPNFTLLGCLKVPHYYYPGWGWVEIIRIKAVLSSTGLELELTLAKKIKTRRKLQNKTSLKHS